MKTKADTHTSNKVFFFSFPLKLLILLRLVLLVIYTNEVKGQKSKENWLSGEKGDGTTLHVVVLCLALLFIQFWVLRVCGVGHARTNRNGSEARTQKDKKKPKE